MGIKATKTPTAAFGMVLRELRLERGLTQERLALDADTERSHISAMERGEKGPSLGTILRLGKALKIRAGEIIFLVEERLEKKSR